MIACYCVISLTGLITTLIKHIKANEVWLVPVTVLHWLMQTDDYRQCNKLKGHDLKVIDRLPWPQCI